MGRNRGGQRRARLDRTPQPLTGWDCARFGGISFGVGGTARLTLGVAGVVAGSRRSFHGGMVAGVVTLAAVTAGYLAVHLPERLAYRADPGSYTSGWNLGRGDLLVPFDLFSASLLLALPWPVVGAALGARSADLSRRGRDGWDLLLQIATAGLRDGDRAWASRCVPSSPTSTSAANGVASCSTAPRPRCASGCTV